MDTAGQKLIDDIRARVKDALYSEFDAWGTLADIDELIETYMKGTN